MKTLDAIRTILAAATLALAGAASAATITIVNNDGAGEGFNDATPVAALPNNPGTTLGAQRLNVFTTAANQWGAQLNSSVTILVRAQMDPQTCDANGAILGSAGPLSALRDFTNAPVAGTWFVIAEANALAGSDLSAANPDINATFNVSIDAGCLPGTTGWWYGLDDTVAIPADKIALMPVVFHEIAHGLGFLSLTNDSNGQLFGSPGRPDIWANFLKDVNLGAGGTLWKDMSNAQRKASAIDDPNLAWAGANVTARGSSYLNPPSALIVTSPAGIAGSYTAQSASFGPAVPLSGVSGTVVAAVDTGGTSTTDACEAITNGAQIAGKIALVDRGTCNFTVKVANAQAVGAIAVVVANNVATGLPGMGGADPTITIPSYGISQADGTTIRNNLGAGVVATLGYDFSTLSGTNSGLVRLYAPNPLESGSSVSHFTTDALPNLLMEPALNQELFSDVDLTTALFTDIFWPLLPQANKAPTISAATQFAALVDTLSPLTEVLFSDADAGTGNLTLTFSVTSGTINLTTQAGVTLAGSGTATASASAPRLTLLQYVVGGNVRFLSAPATTGSVPLTITVNDNGNSGSGGAMSATANSTIVVVAPTPTTTTITTDNPDPSVVGQPITVAYTVVPTPPGSGTPTGNVTVTISGGSETCTASVASGSCTLAPLASGARTLTATYAGAGFFLGSSDTEPHQVNPADTTTTIVSDLPDPTVVGQPTTVTVGVAAASPGSGTPSGTVTVSSTGASNCTIVLPATTCQLTWTTAGAKTIAAVYGGDSNYNGSTATTAPHTVNAASTTLSISDSPDPSVTGETVTITASLAVTSPGAGTPTGVINVTSAGTPGCTITLPATSCTLAWSTIGGKTIDATYVGDGDFAASNAAQITHVVAQATTSLAIADTPDPSAIGQNVTIDATLTVDAPGAGAPTGSIVVTGTATTGCTITLPATSCTLTFTANGAQTLAAVYSGDADFQGSNVTGVPHDVQGLVADLSITKDDGRSNAVVGFALSYTIVVANAGPDTATGATVADAPPAELGGATWTCTSSPAGLCPNASGATAINETVTLASGQSLTYVLTGTVGGTAGGTLTNTATVAAPVGTTDGTPANNSATDAEPLVTDDVFKDSFE